MDAELDQDGQVRQVDVVDLEDEIRRGMVPLRARLRYAPWTGEDWLPLDEVAQLTDAFASPEACFVAHLARPRAPWLTMLILLLVATFGVLQIGMRAGLLDLPVLVSFFDHAAVGFDELVLGSQWWTPWTSQLSHAGPLHLIPNLLVIGWMAWRVEQAYGPGALLLIGAASVGAGALAICLLEDLPAVGASILGFGLWGAVLAIGFRMGDELSYLHVRRRYGFGSLPMFAVLFATSLYTPGATHVGHIFGLLGGGVMAMALAPESFEPRHERGRAILGNASLAAFLAALVSGGGVFLGSQTGLLLWPSTQVKVPEVGATLDLPWRMARHPQEALDMSAWSTSVNSRALLFVGMSTLPDGVPVQEALAEQWALATDGLPKAVPPRKAWPGWESLAWNIVDPDDKSIQDHVEEHILIRGRTVLRAGYRLDGPGETLRAAMYERVLSSMVIGEPAELTDARRRHDDDPGSPRVQYELARELARLADGGELGEADGILGKLAGRDDGWAWDAARLRLELWAQASKAQGRRFQGGGEGLQEAQDWVRAWLLRAPPLDDQIHRPGVEVLVNTGDCETARRHAQGLVDRGDATRPLGMDLLGVVNDGCPPEPAGGG